MSYARSMATPDSPDYSPKQELRDVLRQASKPDNVEHFQPGYKWVDCNKLRSHSRNALELAGTNCTNSDGTSRPSYLDRLHDSLFLGCADRQLSNGPEASAFCSRFADTSVSLCWIVYLDQFHSHLSSIRPPDPLKNLSGSTKSNVRLKCDLVE